MPNQTPGLTCIFLSAIEIDSEVERARYIEQACRGNASLEHRVKILVAAHIKVKDRDFMAQPLALQGATVAYIPHVAGKSGSRAGTWPCPGPCGLLQQSGAVDLAAVLAVHAGQGMALCAQQRFEDARDTFDHAVAVYAEHAHRGEMSGEAAEAFLSILGGRAMALFRMGEDQQALHDVDLVLTMGGDPMAFGLFRAGILARSGEHELGAQAAQQLLDQPRERESTGLFYDAACVFSLALEGLTKHSSLSVQHREYLARRYARQAVGLLHWALELGSQNIHTITEAGRKRDRHLDALRQRKEFKAFLCELKE